MAGYLFNLQCMEDTLKKWETKSSTGKHFDVLDGVRGLAILMVVIYHTTYFNASNGVAIKSIETLLQSFWMGVPIFFVLSGFLISFPFFRARLADNHFWYQDGYASRRAAKIIPPFYLSLLIFATYGFFQSGSADYLFAGLKWAVGLPNIVPTFPKLNSSYWSLIVEAQFYVLLPLLFLSFRGAKPIKTAGFIFITLLCVPLAARLISWPAAADEFTIHFAMERFPCSLDYFGWGVLFSGYYCSLPAAKEDLRALAKIGYAGVALLALSILLCAFWEYKFDIHDHPTRWAIEAHHLLPAISAFLMLFFIFDPECLGTKVLAHRWLRFTGLISYEWFLFHQPVVQAFADKYRDFPGMIPRCLIKTILPVVITFVFSALVYRYFSLPIMKLIRSKVRKEQPAKLASVNAPSMVVGVTEERKR